MFVSLDGNFKLKRKARNIKDHDLSEDWSYFVKDDTYQAWMARLNEVAEVNNLPHQYWVMFLFS
jgi:hypothetical protein